MRGDLRKKLLEKEMTRKEFLQFAGGSLLVLLGLTNVLALFSHLSRSVESPKVASTEASHGFGSHKFGM
jgi:hypothetical protein